jgi:hypothetical protein
MPHPAIIKPTHKAIVAYYETLKAYGEHDVGHETALRSAFQNLPAETAKAHHRLLVPEQRTKVGGKTVIPDATLCDEYNLHRGYLGGEGHRRQARQRDQKEDRQGLPAEQHDFRGHAAGGLFPGQRKCDWKGGERKGGRNRFANRNGSCHLLWPRPAYNSGGRGVFARISLNSSTAWNASTSIIRA